MIISELADIAKKRCTCCALDLLGVQVVGRADIRHQRTTPDICRAYETPVYDIDHDIQSLTDAGLHCRLVLPFSSLISVTGYEGSYRMNTRYFTQCKYRSDPPQRTSHPEYHWFYWAGDEQHQPTTSDLSFILVLATAHISTDCMSTATAIQST